MFHQDEIVDQPMPFDGIVMEKPNIENLNEILSYFEGIGMTGDWLIYYMTQRINESGIMLFRYYGEIIGTGEVRPSISSDGYANIGMTVAANYRRRGLGSYILSSIRRITNERGYKAVCSTSNDNVASFNTITKSGFVCYHIINKIIF